MNLKDAFDNEIFTIEGKEYSDADFQAMPLDDLETLKMRIDKKISGLSASLKEKQIEYSNGGEGATKEWYTRHKNAMSINQRVLTYVNYLIKRRRRNERTISDYFMEAAKAVLPRRDFEKVLTKAHQEMGTKGEGIN
jgi:hypothetical protein